MTDISDFVPLNTVSIASTIGFKGEDYTVLKHNPKNTQIKSTKDGKTYNLNGTARVKVTKKASIDESLAIRYKALDVAFQVGDPVRVVAAGKFQGYTGIVSAITADKVKIMKVGDNRILNLSLYVDVEKISIEEFAKTLLG